MRVVAKVMPLYHSPFKSESHLTDINSRIDGEIQKCKVTIISADNVKKIEASSSIVLHPAHALSLSIDLL